MEDEYLSHLSANKIIQQRNNRAFVISEHDFPYLNLFSITSDVHTPDVIWTQFRSNLDTF